MKADLLITTYNRPDALEMVLLSVINQTKLPDTVIIADDGSTIETSDLIKRYQKILPLEIIHVWHFDDGFKAASIRNKGLAEVKSPYVIIIDGDMVLEKHFIQDHLQNARENQFVQGGRVLLTESKTKQILKSPSGFIPKFFEIGVENRLEKKLTAFRSTFFAKFFTKKLRNMEKVRSCNMSFFMKDVIAVNGFDNRFVGWGREDSEFVERLLNYGLQGRLVKFEALAFHLYHKEETRRSLLRNDLLLQTTIDQKLNQCEDGLSAYLKH